MLKELIGPWIFGVCMFTMLLVAATYLGRIAQYVVSGIPASLILQVTVLLLPAILVKTFAMALLLGGLLSFGRLSGDSEITAIRAAGVSLHRIVLPVAVFSLGVAAVAFWLNEQVVPAAAKQSVKLMSRITQTTDSKKAQPVNYIQVQDGQVVAMFGARNAIPGIGLEPPRLEGVHVVAYDKQGNESFIMFAKELEFTPNNLTRWRIRGSAEIINRLGTYRVVVNGDVWPTNIPQPTATLEEMLAGQTRDFDVYSMSEIQELIRKGKESQNLTPKDVLNYEYGYWNKIALPLAAFIFGTLGATLGIRNHRTGSATGFAVSIAIIFSYFTIANFMNVYASGGVFPPYVASFAPIAIGLIATVVVIWRRNR